jgi:hypothetical protein
MTEEREAAFGKAFLRPQVIFQRFEVESSEFSGPEKKVDDSFYCLGAVTFVPVVAISDNDADLRFPIFLVDIVAVAVTDMLAVEGLY